MTTKKKLLDQLMTVAGRLDAKQIEQLISDATRMAPQTNKAIPFERFEREMKRRRYSDVQIVRFWAVMEDRCPTVRSVMEKCLREDIPLDFLLGFSNKPSGVSQKMWQDFQKWLSTARWQW